MPAFISSLPLLSSRQHRRPTSRRQATLSMVAVRGSSTNPYRIAVLPGDGSGPLVADSVKKILSALAVDQDLHFEFIEAPYGEPAMKQSGSLVPDSTVDVCRSADAVLRSYQGIERGPSATSAHLQLLRKLGAYAQFRPVIMYPQLVKLSTLNETTIKSIDIMLVRDIAAGAISLEDSMQVVDNTTSVIEYTKAQIENIANVAISICEKRSGKMLNIDKADVMSVSKYWRKIVNETVEKYKNSTNNGLVLNNMFVDDFVREIIYKPSAFDVVVTSNLFGDIVAEVIDALVGPQRFSPSFWKGSNSPGVYGPADIYNLQAYPADNSDIGLGPNAIALTRAAAMMLRYELDEPAAANTIQQALRKVMADLATDISSAGQEESSLLAQTAPVQQTGTTMTIDGINGVSSSNTQVIDGVQTFVSATGATSPDLDSDGAKKFISAISNTSADEYANTIVRAMQYLKQYEQMCDPTECGE